VAVATIVVGGRPSATPECSAAGATGARADASFELTDADGVPPPRTAERTVVLSFDVGASRPFCHVDGDAASRAQMVPGRPYPFVAALESRGTS
jgi:hypothetical protein